MSKCGIKVCEEEDCMEIYSEDFNILEKHKNKVGECTFMTAIFRNNSDVCKWIISKKLVSVEFLNDAAYKSNKNGLITVLWDALDFEYPECCDLEYNDECQMGHLECIDNYDNIKMC